MRYYGCTYKPAVNDTRVRAIKVYVGCGSISPFWYVERTSYLREATISELIPIGLN